MKKHSRYDITHNYTAFDKLLAYDHRPIKQMIGLLAHLPISPCFKISAIEVKQ